MQVVVLGVSAALVAPGFWTAIDRGESSGRFEVTLEHIDGPFEALRLEGGIATGSLLPKVRAGSHVLWALRLSAPWSAAPDLDTCLVRQQDEAAIAWSHRQLGKLGPESRTYLVDQPLPGDLKPGRYQIVLDVSLHNSSSVHRLLPSLSIDIAAGAGS